MSSLTLDLASPKSTPNHISFISFIKPFWVNVDLLVMILPFSAILKFSAIGKPILVIPKSLKFFNSPLSVIPFKFVSCHIRSSLNLASSLLIMPFPSLSNSFKASYPSFAFFPLLLSLKCSPNNSLPSDIMPSLFLSYTKKASPLSIHAVFSITPSPS